MGIILQNAEQSFSLEKSSRLIGGKWRDYDSFQSGHSGQSGQPCKHWPACVPSRFQEVGTLGTNPAKVAGSGAVSTLESDAGRIGLVLSRGMASARAGGALFGPQAHSWRLVECHNLGRVWHWRNPARVPKALSPQRQRRLSAQLWRWQINPRQRRLSRRPFPGAGFHRDGLPPAPSCILQPRGPNVPHSRGDTRL